MSDCPAPNNVRLSCPHCKGETRFTEFDALRQSYTYRCNACGFTFTVVVEVMESKFPSMYKDEIPDEVDRLPTSRDWGRVRRTPIKGEGNDNNRTSTGAL